MSNPPVSDPSTPRMVMGQFQCPPLVGSGLIEHHEAMQEINPLLIDLPIPIHTPRLLMRSWERGDGAKLLDAKRESWAELGRYCKWASGPSTALTESSEEATVRRRSAEFIMRTEIEFPAFSKMDGRLLGVGEYHAIDWTGRMFSTGYWIRTSEAGKGLATEMLCALTRAVSDRTASFDWRFCVSSHDSRACPPTQLERITP